MFLPSIEPNHFCLPCGVVVLGATGRLGRILRTYWGPEATVWQSRQQRRGYRTCDLLGNPQALQEALALARSVVLLAGPGGRGGGIHLSLTRAVEAAMPASARLILPSSAAIYGAQRGSLTETTPPRPQTPYAFDKAAVEAWARGLPEGRTTVLRIGNVAGADAILGGWKPGFQLDRFMCGSGPRRSYIGPRSFAHVLAALLSHPGPLPPVLNVPAPGAIEMADLLRAANLPFSWRPAPRQSIKEVALETRLLETFVQFTPEMRTAAGMVAEWRALHTMAQAA